MKRSRPRGFADRHEQATKILRRRVRQLGILSVIVGKDDISAVNIGKKTIDFSLHTGYYNYISLSLNHVGSVSG